MLSLSGILVGERKNCLAFLVTNFTVDLAAGKRFISACGEKWLDNLPLGVLSSLSRKRKDEDRGK